MGLNFKQYHKCQKMGLGQQMTNNRPNNQPTMGTKKKKKKKDMGN
jgi:hypothetical protein